MEESLRGALQALYCRHYTDVTSLSCYLERQLPLREPFFQLKRVPHFQVRDDLHHSEAPAYSPILRLESASPEDLSHRGRAGSRRVAVEGELGTGKTFLCYHLLHHWAQPRAKPPPVVGLTKTPRLDDLSTFKLLVYLDCVRLPVADFLAKGQQPPSRKRHVQVVACALVELLAPTDSRAFLDRLYDWLAGNQSEVCVVFDNLDGSDTWRQLVEEALREPAGFGKILVCSTPGRVSKNNVDSLYYCYGLHPDYSVKLIISKLKRVSLDIIDRAALPKLLDASQELLRNPLTQSLVVTYLKSLGPRTRPRTQFEFIEELVSSAMVGDSYPVTSAPPRSPVVSPVSPTSLMTICETVAFECLETNTNYFSKFKFPAHFWTKHLCDCRILHEVHDVTQQGAPVVSFTSRSIRDYLASKRVCRYLLSDRESEQFLEGLIHKRQFHSVVKFCIRHLVKLQRLDVVHTLMDRLLAAGPKRWVKAYKQAEAFSRGRLSEQSEVLSWLRETDFHPDLLQVVAAHFPTILELSYHDCSPETIRNFVAVAERAGEGSETLHLQGLVLYMDGLFSNPDLGLGLARALRHVRSLTTLVLCLRCVVDTGFVVEFLCRVFEANPRVRNLTLEGPFNSAENLSPTMHKRVKQVFCRDPSVVGLQTLSLEHINYHHRLAYLLGCWPHALFHRLELRKCNLDSVTASLGDKLRQARHLSCLVLDHCHVLSATLEAVLHVLCEESQRLRLTSLTLSLLSTARHFGRCDAVRASFKPSLTVHGCRLVARFLSLSPTLAELALCYDGIDDVKIRVLVEAASRSETLTSLDLSGNVIGDASFDDVSSVVTGARRLSALYLHENGFSADVRTRLVNLSLDKASFKLSL